MIRLDQAKMSKSEGNIFVLSQALEVYGRDALIMYFVAGHYRQPVEFDDERLEEARTSVGRIQEAARRLVPGPSPEWSKALKTRFFDALANDFDTPGARAAVFDWVRQANRDTSEGGSVGSSDLEEMLDVFGLANLLEADESQAPAEVIELAQRRERARRERDFAQADELRDEIRRRGWEVRDGPEGPELLPAA
jgi:cysteinyl-tRNA synthetase